MSDNCDPKLIRPCFRKLKLNSKLASHLLACSSAVLKILYKNFILTTSNGLRKLNLQLQQVFAISNFET